MNRTCMRHIALLSVLACAVVATVFFAMLRQEVWIARFSYRIMTGADETPFFYGNKELSTTFASPSFMEKVIAQCRACKGDLGDETMLAETITNVSIRVEAKKNDVLCCFELVADSCQIAKDVAMAYLDAMRQRIDDDNRARIKKTTSEVSALLSRDEKMLQKAHEAYEEARKRGGGDLAERRREEERLTSECAALRRKMVEIESAAAKRSDRLEIVCPLSVERKFKRP